MAETFSTFSLKPGDAAPEFELPDPSGARHSLSSVSGERGLLLVFACNHCPYVIHLAKELGQLAATLKRKGIGTVAVASNDVEKYPQDGPEHMGAFARENGWEFPYVCDEDQAVAKAYGAACTPDFFLLDERGCLYYAGQFDDSRPKSGERATGADLQAAAMAMLKGDEAPLETRPASGCNIKWKPGNEPAYFG